MIPSLIVSGMPSATVVDDPKLDRMSWRTIPLWLRTSGPFEPSPGYGPAVSSGIALVGVAVLPALPEVELLELELLALADEAGVDVVGMVAVLDDPLHAATTVARPAP